MAVNGSFSPRIAAWVRTCRRGHLSRRRLQAPQASATAAATDYEFTLIEMRMNSKGSGEGKTSLATKVIVDGDAKTLASG